MTEETTTTNDAPAASAATVEDTALGAAATQSGSEEPKDEASGEGVKEEPAADVPASIVGAPEAYDPAAFTLPEGMEFDGEMFDLVKDDLKGMDLSQDGAAKVVGLFAEKVIPKIQERAAQAQDDAAAELRANLARDLQNDPEVGGKALDESRSYAAKAIAHFIPDASQRSEFSTFLNESGLGNHALLMRIVAGAGRAISEASTPTGETASRPLSESEKFYGRKG